MFFSLNGVRLRRWFVIIFVLAAFSATVILAVWLSLSFNFQGQPKARVGEYSVEFSEDNFNNQFFNQFDLKAHNLVDKREVILPQKDDAVFSDYIAFQKEQGLDTAKYCQKKVYRYIYGLECEEEQEDRGYAEILVSEQRVIAAHLTDFVYGSKPEPLICSD